MSPTSRPTRRRLVMLVLALTAVVAACGDTPAVEEVGPAEAADLLDEQGDLIVIDVRTPAEFADGHLEGARNLDLEGGELEERLDELDPGAAYVVYCATGNRSGQAARLMAAAGFDEVYDAGGYDDLADAGVPTST